MAVNLFNTNRGNVLDSRRIIAPTGYRTPESGQVEKRIYDNHGNNTNYEAIYTITTGKTFFVSDLIITNAGADQNIDIATGAPASEVIFLKLRESTGSSQYPFNVPLMFTSGTIISWKFNSAVTTMHIMIIGFEE